MAVYEEVLSQTDVDMFIFWEGISAGTGSMVSPAAIREFMVPYYRRMTDFLKEKGVDIIFVDTDGDCFDIIPVFLEGGLTEATQVIVDLRENYKIFCSMVIYPVVPKDVIMLRIIPTAVHTLEDVDYTIKAFTEIKKRLESGKYKDVGMAAMFVK